MADIQIYAKSIALAESNGSDSLNIHLDGVEVSQVIAELDPSDVLECIDIDKIREYLSDSYDEDAQP